MLFFSHGKYTFLVVIPYMRTHCRLSQEKAASSLPALRKAAAGLGRLAYFILWTPEKPRFGVAFNSP